MPQPQRLPDPHPRRRQQREQEPVTQPLLAIDHRRDLLQAQRPRQTLALRQPHRPAPRSGARDAVQKRLERTPAAARADHQIPRQLIPAPPMELIERHHRREHPVHRRRRPLCRLLAEDQHILSRPARPRCELTQLDNGDPVPRQPAPLKKRPEQAKVPRVRLDRVRRALDPGQPTKELVDHLDHTPVWPDHRPRHHPARRHPHPPRDEPPQRSIRPSVIHDAPQTRTTIGRNHLRTNRSRPSRR